jgi:ankyrin repeat protein
MVFRQRALTLKIHEYSSKGDLAGVQAELDRGESIEAFDDQGLTPLMKAAGSLETTPTFLQSLIELGANVNGLARAWQMTRITESEAAEYQKMGIDVSYLLEDPKLPSIKSVLVYAVQSASRVKIEVLLDAGADPTYVDPCGYGVLNCLASRQFPESDAERHELASRLIEAGGPLDVASAYGETALSRASNQGDFGLVKLLLEAGADPTPLEWDELSHAVAFNNLPRVMELVTGGASLETRDRWERTPFLLAIQNGNTEIASFLLVHGSDPAARSRGSNTALMHAIERDDASMLSWLIEQGADVEATDDQGNTPLIRAAQQGSILCAHALLAAGVDVGRRNQSAKNAIGEAAKTEIVEMLEQQGECLDEVREDMRQQLTGHAGLSLPEFAGSGWRPYLHQTFGCRNPERMNNEFWDAMVRTRCYAWTVGSELGLDQSSRPAVWCCARYGQSLTRLADGRLVEIGGEHEDHYDIDFCIYNDVIVHHGDGTFDIFGYPEAVFPPTDFHTATLFGEWIYIIGSLGYMERRVPDFTPVYRLNINSFSIEPVDCRGDLPGWIHKHRASRISPHEVQVSGGEIQSEAHYGPNPSVYYFDIRTGVWRRM